MPKSVCILCLSYIRTSYHFRLQVERAYETLLQQCNVPECIAVPNIKDEPMSCVVVSTSFTAVAATAAPGIDESDILNETQR